MITPGKVANTLSRYFSSFTEGLKSASFLKLSGGEQSRIKTFLDDLNDENSGNVMLIDDFLRPFMIDKSWTSSEYKEAINKIPAKIKGRLKSDFPGSGEGSREFMLNEILSNFFEEDTGKLKSILGSYMKWRRAERGSGKSLSDRATVKVLAPDFRGIPQQEAFAKKDMVLKTLLIAGKFKATIDRNSVSGWGSDSSEKSSETTYYTKPGTLSGTGDPEFEKQFNKEGLELVLKSGATDIVRNNKSGDRIQSITITLDPGKTYTFRHTDTTPDKYGKGIKGLHFLVLEKSKQLSDMEESEISLEPKDIFPFIDHLINAFKSVKKFGPKIVSESEFIEKIKGMSKEDLDSISIDSFKDSEEDLEMDSEKETLDVRETPEQKKERLKKEETDKEERYKRIKKEQKYPQHLLDDLSAEDKKEISNKLNALKIPIANTFEKPTPTTTYASVGDILSTSNFVKKLLDSILDDGGPFDEDHWIGIVKENFGKWIAEDPVLSRVYLNTMQKRMPDGKTSRLEVAKKAIAENKRLKFFFEEAKNKLNEEERAETGNNKALHPFVSGLEKDTINFKNLLGILNSDKDLYNEFMNDDRAYEALSVPVEKIEAKDIQIGKNSLNNLLAKLKVNILKEAEKRKSDSNKIDDPLINMARALDFHKEVEKRDREEKDIKKKKFEGLSFPEGVRGKKLRRLQEESLLVKNDEDRKKILDDLRQLAGKKPFSKEEWESFKKSKEYEDIASQKQVVPAEVWEELAKGAYPEYIRHEGPKDYDLLNISKWAVKLAFGKIKNVRGV